ncbi:hypothetical protein ACET7V_10830 [Aeromonas sanarellii]|uniref:hypothetical protein n=1 Tax=Aeromonas sanarellii TaxID=633415 RepID=UPI0038D16A24
MCTKVQQPNKAHPIKFIPIGHMAIPAPRTAELLETLVAYLNAGQTLPELDAARIKREIRVLDDPIAKSLLTALCHGAMGKELEAIAAFEAAMKDYQDSAIGFNYCTYLRQIGRFADFVQLSFYCADQFEDPEHVQFALNAAQIICDMKRTAAFALKLSKYYPGERGDAVLTSSGNFIRMIQDIEDELGVQETDINSLSMACLEIAAKYRKDIGGSRITVADEMVVLCLELYSCEPDELADMNHDLAMKIAENEKLFELPATAWFRDHVE